MNERDGAETADWQEQFEQEEAARWAAEHGNSDKEVDNVGD